MMKRTHFFAASCLIIGSLSSQNKTISSRNADEREPVAAHKVMLVPFEPRLYLGEIDRQIHNETNLTSAQIRQKFRDGLNEQLFRSLRSAKYNVLDLMDDTVKYRKDIEGIYEYLAYDYLKVPDQNNYKPPRKEKEEKKIEKGQLAVETNNEKRFMNARITNPKVVPLLYGKYKTDLFVFINQLDIRAGGSPDPVNGAGSGARRISVHYTVYSYDAKEINSGVAEAEFPQNVNNPKKIIEKYFPLIANTITQRISKGIR